MFYRDVILEEVMPLNEFNIKTILHTIKEKLLQFLSLIRKIIEDIRFKIFEKKYKNREKKIEELEHEARKKNGSVKFSDVFEENDTDLNIRFTRSKKYKYVYSLPAEVSDYVKENKNCTKEDIYSKIGTSNFSSLFDTTEDYNIYRDVEHMELDEGIDFMIFQIRNYVGIDWTYGVDSDDKHDETIKQIKENEKTIQFYIERIKEIESSTKYTEEKKIESIKELKSFILQETIDIQWYNAYLENAKKNEKEYDALIDRIYRRFGQYINS